MNNDKAIALLRRMQEPEAYEPQITAEAFEALGMAIRAIRMTEVLAGELDGCPLPAPCHKLFSTGWCKEHCKSQEATAAYWLKYAEVVVDEG